MNRSTATLLATTTLLGLLGASVPAPAARGGACPCARRRRPPSSAVQREGLFTVQYPSNWRVDQAEDGASFAPGGVKDLGGGRRALLYGLIVGQYEASGALEDAAAGLVSQVLVTHPDLRPRDGASRPQEVEGGALTMALSGRSSLTGEEEWVTIYVRRLPQGRIVYAFGIVPGPEYDEAAGTFAQMVRLSAGAGELIRHAARSVPDAAAYLPRE